jgi:hypothetical protein
MKEEREGPASSEGAVQTGLSKTRFLRILLRQGNLAFTLGSFLPRLLTPEFPAMKGYF